MPAAPSAAAGRRHRAVRPARRRPCRRAAGPHRRRHHADRRPGPRRARRQGRACRPTRRCTFSSPATTARPTGASSSTARRASASSTRARSIKFRVLDDGVTGDDRAGPRHRSTATASRCRRETVLPGAREPVHRRHRPWRTEHHRVRGRAACRRADAGQQPRRRLDRGHPREPARAAGLRRAARRRAHLAQPAEVRRLGRPRPLHHPAPAGEAGRHADQPAVADRLPDPRAVLGEDRSVRPDHLRPLPASRRAAAALLRQHRPLRARRRRAAGRRRSGLCRRRSPLRHAAVAGAARRADRPGDRGALSTRPSPTSASAIR